MLDACNLVKLKRERAKKLMLSADLAIHKAVSALTTAEAIKASCTGGDTSPPSSSAVISVLEKVRVDIPQSGKKKKNYTKPAEKKEKELYEEELFDVDVELLDTRQERRELVEKVSSPSDSLFDVDIELLDHRPCLDDHVQLETPIELAEGQTDGGQTAIDQHVDLPGVTSVQTDSVLNLKLPVGPQGAESLPRSSANLGHCNQLEPAKVVNLLDDDDVVILDPKQAQSLLEDKQATQIGKLEVQLETPIASAEGQMVIDQHVNIPQTPIASALNLKLPISPPGAQSLPGLSANLGHCNRLKPPRDNKLHKDDDDVVILDPKRERCELVENVSRVSDYEENFSNRRSDTVCVQGYRVKRSVAKILNAIFKKHGDIAAECVIKTVSLRSSILEGVCEVAKQVQANNVEKLKEMENRVLDANAVNVDVSWLQAPLDAFRKRKKANEEYNLLKEMKANVLSAKNAAQINLRKRRAELAAAQERSKKARRCAGALCLVRQSLTDNFFRSKAEMASWSRDEVV